MTPNEAFASKCVRRASDLLGMHGAIQTAFCHLQSNLLACAQKKPNVVFFDIVVVNGISDYDICDIALHECCHIKSKIDGHGKHFRRVCASVGADPTDSRNPLDRAYGWTYLIRDY